MKTMSKLIIGLCIAGLLVLGLTAPADAQLRARADFNVRANVFRTHFGGYYHPYVYPHLGLVVRVLPFGYYSFVWNSYPYYYAGGLFYQACADGSYQVIAPPVGAEVPSLPINAEIVTIDGNPYYQYQGIYYESVIHADGKIAYKVVGVNGVLNTGSQTNTSLPLVGDMTDQLPAASHKVILSGKTYWVTPDEVYLEEVKKDNKLSYRVVSVPGQNTAAPQPDATPKRL